MTNNKFGKVAVLMGGKSAERAVSLRSGAAVLSALYALGIDAHRFDPAEQDLYELKKQNFQRCFISLHGRYGEDGTIQGALELLGIPYTGSGVMASSVAMNKVMTKRIWQSMGLSTPHWLEVNSIVETEKAFEHLGAPMIVKPGREGSTLGLTKVNTLAECEAAYKIAAQMDSLVLCEQYISGDEVTCTIIDEQISNQELNYIKSKVLPLIKIIAPDSNYDYEHKYNKNDVEYRIPCELPIGEEEIIQNLALKSYQALGCRGWARADVMIDIKTRQPYLLEINTSPGMTDHSLVPMAAKAVGINFEQLCLQVLKLAKLDN